MKDEHNVKRSRNARLNQARREAQNLTDLLDPDMRPADDNRSDESWNELFANARDMGNDIHQCIHEASAYDNVFKAAANPGRSQSELPSLHQPDRLQGEDASQDKREGRTSPAAPDLTINLTPADFVAFETILSDPSQAENPLLDLLLGYTIVSQHHPVT